MRSTICLHVILQRVTLPRRCWTNHIPRPSSLENRVLHSGYHPNLKMGVELVFLRYWRNSWTKVWVIYVHFVFSIKASYIFQTEISISSMILLFIPNHRNAKTKIVFLTLKPQRFSSHLLHLVRSPWFVLILKFQAKYFGVSNFFFFTKLLMLLCWLLIVHSPQIRQNLLYNKVLTYEANASVVPS